MKILLWKVGALGDVLMTTPLARQLRAQFPQARIDYLVGRAFAAALQGNPHIDQIVTFDQAILFSAQAWRLRGMLRLLDGYDAIYVLDKHWIFSGLARLAGAAQRVGFRRRALEGLPLTHLAPYGALRHEIDCYLDLAGAAGWTADAADRRIEPPRHEVPPMPEGATALINSGGSNAYEDTSVRRLPDALFAQLAQACAAQGPVVFLGSASEAAYYDRVAGGYGLNLCGRTSIAQAAGALKKAARVITTDTGLMHLAGALNDNVTAVFGPTHPLRKCPPGARWVWEDQARYDARYEVFGTAPKGRYFGSLTAEQIMAAAAQPAPAGQAVKEAVQ